MRFRWKRPDPTPSDEAREHYERALGLKADTYRIISHERRLIRENNFAPKVARALREGTP